LVARLKKILKEFLLQKEIGSQVATVSANNDEEIGKMISDAIDLK